jgi:hypothetical protein
VYQQQDAAQNLSLLHDTPTKETGDKDDNKNTRGDGVDANKKNAHYREIKL